MNKTVLALGTLALLGFAQPATAMCGAGQQAQAAGQTSGGMCAMGQTAVDDPMADKPAQSQPRSGSVCPCCRNMAMMRSGTGVGGGMQHNMPSMDMPKPQ
jgi:hypothetical protein